MASMQDMQSLVGYTDLLAMPADGRRYEIHGGELVVVPSPRHQFAVQAVFLLLHERPEGLPWPPRSTSSSTSTTSCSPMSCSSGRNAAI